MSEVFIWKKTMKKKINHSKGGNVMGITTLDKGAMVAP